MRLGSGTGAEHEASRRARPWLVRLGAACARHARAVLALWAVLLAAGAALLLADPPPTTIDYRFPGAEYQRVLDEARAELPELRGGAARLVLTTGDGGPFDEAQRAGTARLAEELAALPVVTAAHDPFTAEEDLLGGELGELRAEVEGRAAELREAGAGREEIEETIRAELAARDDLPVSMAEAELLWRQAELAGSGRFVSEDGAAALLGLQLTAEGPDLTEAERSELLDTAQAHAPEGVVVAHGQDMLPHRPGLLGATETAGIAVAALVLLATLGTLLAAGLPLLLALAGVTSGLALTSLLADFAGAPPTDPFFALMLGVSLAIDYMLLLAYRYRRRLQDGDASGPATVGAVTGTAGRAVLIAGLTNIVALAALAVLDTPFLAVIGLTAAGVVAVVLLAVLTAGPAMLSLLGPRVLPRRRERRRSARAASWGRVWGRLVTRRPVLAIVLPLLVLGALAAPALGMRLGLPHGGAEPPASSAHAAYQATREHFGPGANGHLFVLVDLPGHLDETGQRERALDVAQDLAGDLQIEGAVLAGASPDGATRLLQLTPTIGPEDPQTDELVTELRAGLPRIAAAHEVELGLTGQSVAAVELTARLTDMLPRYLALVVLLCLAAVALAFRSLWLPLLTAAGYVLSLLAALGAVTAVYQRGWLGGIVGAGEPGVVVAFLPLLLGGVLFGLAIDYQLFLSSAVREARLDGASVQEAVVRALHRTGPVILACAVVMTAVFVGFAVAETTTLRQAGLALAFGVLVDALLVRLTMVPAALSLLGGRREPAATLPIRPG